MTSRWLVQRRLPGTQGANGCWSDEGVIEAASAAEAVRVVVEGYGTAEHMVNHTDFRAAPEPAWEMFNPRIERRYETVVLVGGDTRGPDA